MKLFLNEIVTKNTTVSNNIILVSTEGDQSKYKNSMESANSFVSSSRGINETKFTAQSSTNNVDLSKGNYLTSKHSIIEKKPEGLLQSFDSHNAIMAVNDVKLPVVSNGSLQPNTTKSINSSKKNYIKFESQQKPKQKYLPSINTKKDLSEVSTKRTPKNRELSMTVIKSGRLALQDKNSSVHREQTKQKGAIVFPMNRKEA